jgi:predicted negative regulator of RcsB-dependent stress response
LDIYQTEDEQVEAMKKWWAENGKSAIFGVVFGLIAIFGWREWQDYEAEQAAAASQLYQEMIIATRDARPEEVSEKATEIVNSYESTGYAIFAKLGLAKIAVANGKLDDAVADLQWALDNTSQDSLRHIITLRIADILISQNKLGETKSLLSNNTNRGEFAASYLEVEGDVERLEGNTEAAIDAYQKALNLALESRQDTTMLDMKLDDLGHAKQL